MLHLRQLSASKTQTRQFNFDVMYGLPTRESLLTLTLGVPACLRTNKAAAVPHCACVVFGRSLYLRVMVSQKSHLTDASHTQLGWLRSHDCVLSSTLVSVLSHKCYRDIDRRSIMCSSS